MRRKKNLEHYRQGENGRVEYTGSYTQILLEEEAFAKGMRRQLGAGLCVLALLIGAGCVPGTGMEGHFYLLFPYAAELILCVLQIRCIWDAKREGLRQRRYFYEKNQANLRGMTWGLWILCVWVLAGTAWLLIRGKAAADGAGACLLLISQASGALTEFLALRRPVPPAREVQG